MFLYSEVLGERLDWLNGVVRARRPVRIPVVMSCDEVRAKKKARVNRRTRHLAAAIVRESMKLNQIEDLTAGAVRTVRKGRDIKTHYVMRLGNA